MSHLPGILYDIAQSTDRDCAYILAQKWGGLNLYIPKPQSLTPRHRLVRALGMEAAVKLCTLYQCEYIDIPLGPALPPHKKSIILELAENRGLSHRAIARKAKTSERHVRRVLNAGKDSKQLSLL